MDLEDLQKALKTRGVKLGIEASKSYFKAILVKTLDQPPYEMALAASGEDLETLITQLLHDWDMALQSLTGRYPN